MKKLLLILSAVLSLSILCSCETFNFGSFQKSEEEQIELDLTQFSDHGNWSDGIIWCETEQNDWEKGTTHTFAYYDKKGNRISEPFDSERYTPRDSENGWIVLFEESPYTENGIVGYTANAGNYKASVYRASPQFSYVSYIYCYRPFDNTPYDSDFSLAATESEFFYVGKLDDSEINELYCMNSNGAYIRFRLPDDIRAVGFHRDDLEIIEHDSGYYFVGNATSIDTEYKYIFDDNGNLVLDFNNTRISNVYKIEITSDNNMEVSFIGADHNYYICTMDLQGNILKSPTAL